MNILDTVTDVEGKVVDYVRAVQEPVVSYVRRGVEFADGKLPNVSYPASLPQPGAIVDSQFEFAKALLDAQQDFVKSVADAVAPLIGADAKPRRAAKAAKSAA